MTKKFHINPETGVVGECRAEKKCSFESDDYSSEHYDTYEEAYYASEKMLEEELSSFETYQKQASAERVIEKKMDKIYKSKLIKIEDAEDVHKTPFYLINSEDATSEKITRISRGKEGITYWSEDGNSKVFDNFDTVIVSQKSAEEIIKEK